MVWNATTPWGNYPTLNAKAAETRHLIPVFRILIQEHHIVGDEVSTHRLLAMEYISEWYDIIMSHGIFLPREAGERQLACARKFSIHYQKLVKWSQNHGYFWFNSTPKFHDFMHLAHQAKFLNPRFVWTYKQEDFMGLISHIGMSCQHGTPSYALSLSVAEKWQMLAHVRLTCHCFQD